MWPQNQRPGRSTSSFRPPLSPSVIMCVACQSRQHMLACQSHQHTLVCQSHQLLLSVLRHLRSSHTSSHNVYCMSHNVYCMSVTSTHALMSATSTHALMSVTSTHALMSVTSTHAHTPAQHSPKRLCPRTLNVHPLAYSYLHKHTHEQV